MKIAKKGGNIAFNARNELEEELSESVIYGGLANSWDYGPLGVELKNNVKKAWMKKFVQESIYNVGMDSAILMNPKTWEASGHLSTFSDPLIDCKECKTRHRADK